MTSNRVLIDIGHGQYDEPRGDRPAYDPGAVSPTGWAEFQVNLVTAVAMQERLQTLGHFTSFVPFGLQLFARGLYAKDFDVFVSIHHNAMAGKSQGTEVAVHAKTGTDDDRDLAAGIAKTVSSALGIKNRGVIDLRLAVLSGARKTAVRAAVLTEGFFIDVPGIDLVGLARLEGQAMAAAVNDWLRR